MGPFIHVRARRAVPALGAICLATTTLTILPTAARSDATAARVADVTPGHSRLNVVAGRIATVTGRTNPGIAGRPFARQRRADDQW